MRTVPCLGDSCFPSALLVEAGLTLAKGSVAGNNKTDYAIFRETAELSPKCFIDLVHRVLEWVVTLQSEQIQPLLSQDWRLAWRPADFFFAVTSTKMQHDLGCKSPCQPGHLALCQQCDSLQEHLAVTQRWDKASPPLCPATGTRPLVL